MGKFNPKDYTEVKDRLKWYKEDNPDYRIVTEVVRATENLDDVIVRASIYKTGEELQKGVPHSTGIAEELRGAGFVNGTSHVENCETSAIGRALANIDYHGSDKRPSREEMDKVERTKKAKENKKKEPKPEPKKEPETEKEPFDSDDYFAMIDGFEKADALVDWFNEELKRRDGEDKETFKDTHLSAVREKASELYDRQD